VLCCMEKTRHLRGRTWLICVCVLVDLALIFLPLCSIQVSRRLTMAAAFPQLLSHCAEG
jgi:hypothetical protein